MIDAIRRLIAAHRAAANAAPVGDFAAVALDLAARAKVPAPVLAWSLDARVAP